MQEHEERYQISDLAQRVGVSPRTIRYYTEEGLLPQPDVDGKYAFYSHTHLIRLQFIKILKDTYLPLREIRQVVTGMSDEQIEVRVENSASYAKLAPYDSSEPDRSPERLLFGSAQGATPAEPNSAQEYIAKVLKEHDQKMGRRADREVRPTSDHAVPEHSQRVLNQHMVMEDRIEDLRTTSFFEERRKPEDRKEVEHWQKYQLADGVELLVKIPSDRNTQYGVHQLIALARKLFT